MLNFVVRHGCSAREVEKPDTEGLLFGIITMHPDNSILIRSSEISPLFATILDAIFNIPLSQ